MLKTLITIFSIPELRTKVLFTLFILIVFRIGAHITIPGINSQILEDYLAQNSGGQRGLVDYIDLFAGGAFARLSLFALGIMPYISASIVMQLMMVVVPSLQKMQKEGEFGRRKLNQYTRYGTVILCAAQAYGIVIYIDSLHTQIFTQQNQNLIDGGLGVAFTLMTILTITTGTMVLMWFGELVTERGIGNGTSLIIFTGIVSSAPAAIYQFWRDIQGGGAQDVTTILALVLLIIFIAMIGLSIVLTEGTRKIPLQYGKKIVGRRMMQGSSQSLPIKVNAANVMPIIFASSLMMFPSQLATMLQGNYQQFAAIIQSYLAPGTISYMLIYVVLIIFFAYFYTALQYNPKDLAEALKKNGGYIPGIRPGTQTEEYIQKILSRITLSGAIFLSFIAIAPDIIMKIWNLQKYQAMTSLFGGTSLLIIVGVGLDTLKQIESQLVMRQYEGFMDKNRKSPAKARMVR